jgi:DNA (cytosine-5)-methyltransferase 1
MNELALFAGAGGGILGGKLLGWRTVCAVEYDAYAASVLVARQNDGCLEPFPVWDDVRTFDGRPWRGIAQVVSGGFPCTDISVAGKGAGIEGKESGLWSEMARIIGEVRPKHVFVENSPALAFRGLGRVLGDLAQMGYNARWGVLGADACGADHHRARMWVAANADVRGCEECGWPSKPIRPKPTRAGNYGQEAERPLLGMDDGLAHWVDRMHAIGNGQVACVAALAWRLLGGPTA